MSNFNTLYPEGKKIKVANEEFTITPLVLGTRTKVLRVITAIFKEYMLSAPGITRDQLQDVKISGELIVSMINIAGERLIEIYEVVLGKDKDWLNANVKITDEIEIIQAMLEVNDLPFLLKQAKGLVSTFQTSAKAG